VINKLGRIQRELLQDLGREPTPEELAKEMDITPEKVLEIQQYAREPISLDQTIGDEGEAALADSGDADGRLAAARVAGVPLQREEPSQPTNRERAPALRHRLATREVPDLRLVEHHHGGLRGRRGVSVEGTSLMVVDDSDWRVVEWQGFSYRRERPKALTVEETAAARGLSGAAGELSAPMPGRIVKVSVEEGQHVSQNQPLVVLEAMKMEHVVEAPHAGVVTDLRVAVGDQVASGARLLTIGSAAGKAPLQ